MSMAKNDFPSISKLGTLRLTVIARLVEASTALGLHCAGEWLFYSRPGLRNLVTQKWSIGFQLSGIV